MADKIILRFLRPATPTPMEFQAARARLAADAEALLAPLPGFFGAFAEHFRNIRAGLIWAAILFGLGNIHDNLQFLFYVAGFFLLTCIIALFRIFESLENFGDLRDKHRAYYRELAEDIRACSDYESFYELREGKEATRLYR
jgi:hypothetical protein